MKSGLKTLAAHSKGNRRWGNLAHRFGGAGYLALCLVILTAGCSQQSKFERHFQKGEAHLKAEEYTRAAIEYKNALRFSPSNEVVFARLGLVFQREGDNHVAGAYLAMAMSLDTNDLPIQVQFGRLLLDMDARYYAPTVRAQALRVLDRQPTNENALRLLADTPGSTATNDMAEAKKRFSIVESLLSKSPGYQVALGNLYLRQGEAKKAERAYRTALALDPKNGDAYWGLGWIFASTNNLEQAEAPWKSALELLPLRSKERVAYADVKIYQKKVAEARLLLLDLTKKAPDYLPARFRLAEIALQEKKYDDCGATISRILAQSPRHFETLLLQVKLARAQGQTAKAIAALEDMRKFFPERLALSYELAVAHWQDTNAPAVERNIETTKWLNQTIDAYSTNYDGLYYEAKLFLADVYRESGQPAAAISLLSDLNKRLDVLTNPPVYKQSVIRLTRLYEAQDDPKGLEAVYETMVKAMPADVDGWYLLGKIRKYRKNEAGARAAYEKAQELAPDNLQTISALAELDLVEKKTNAAMARILKAVEKNPKAPEPLVMQSAVQLAIGQTNGAQASLEKAIEIEPNAAGAYIYLARIYVAGGKAQAALDKLQSLLDKYPKDPKAITNLNRQARGMYLSTLMLKATVHETAKDYPSARAAYERIIEAMPLEAGAALNNLAFLLAERLGDLPKARTYANEARERYPKDPSIADTLGWILYRQKDYAQALPLIKESAAGLPNNAEILYHLGMVYAAVGDPVSASRELRLSLKKLEDTTSGRIPSNLGDTSWKKEAEACLKSLKSDARN